MLLTLNVGNTHTMLVIWQERTAVTQLVWKTGLNPPLHKLKRYNQTHTLVCAGVVPIYLHSIGETLKEALPKVTQLRFRKTLHPRLEIQPKPHAKVGDDRVAAACGALYFNPDTPSIFVDAGTALTVNAVDPVNGLLGGTIMPGERLCLQALNAGTAQLPALPPAPDDARLDALGQSTLQAIRMGARIMQLGAATQAIGLLARTLGETTRLIFTGGNGALLHRELTAHFAALQPRYEPLLIHHGLREVWNQSMETSP